MPEAQRARSSPAALLTQALVYRWGEVVPRRLPVLAGRRILPAAVVIAALLGGLLVTLVAVSGSTGLATSPSGTG